MFSCKKEVVEGEKPYSRVSIYEEKFEDDQSWVPVPEDSYYTPDKECVRVEDNMLKLTFDQEIPNCGCAWVGAKKSITNLESIPRNRLGIRIKLNRGFFQEMVRYHNSVDPFGNPSTPGHVISESSFHFISPNIQMSFINPFNARFHEDSTVSENFNRIEGVEFVLINNLGETIFIIDGVKVNPKLANISKATITNQEGIDLRFKLGHQPEFSPRLDELFIEELEIFTWKGKYPD